MKVLVGLSGGVDSAAVAYLLKNEGYEVIGATMKVWADDTDFGKSLKAKGCFSAHQEEDIEAARKIARSLDIPYYVFDCSEEYKKIVLSNFKAEYLAGRKLRAFRNRSSFEPKARCDACPSGFECALRD